MEVVNKDNLQPAVLHGVTVIRLTNWLQHNGLTWSTNCQTVAELCFEMRSVQPSYQTVCPCFISIAITQAECYDKADKKRPEEDFLCLKKVVLFGSVNQWQDRMIVRWNFLTNQLSAVSDWADRQVRTRRTNWLIHNS